MVVTHVTAQPGRGPGAWTIGNFDVEHLGHQPMLSRVVTVARRKGLAAGVLSFEPLPREHFAAVRGADAPPRVARLREKLELFAAAGLDRAHIARFDARFASMPATQFIDDTLCARLQLAWLLVGRDFRFGAGRSGDFAMLEGAARRHGFELEAMPEVSDSEGRISSSRVREALERADLEGAARLLGRPYAVSGRVVHGAKLGRSLGFPTANIVLPRRAPLAGIYVVEAQGADAASPARWLPGVASIGRRPTVNTVPTPLLEVHLFEVTEALYGRHLRVRFLARLRDEKKYDNLAELRAAIAQDVAQAKEHFVTTHG
ncbi:MAG: bifunctional riboflavin kinase/FAD synthetase [bacterium]